MENKMFVELIKSIICGLYESGAINKDRFEEHMLEFDRLIKYK